MKTFIFKISLFLLSLLLFYFIMSVCIPDKNKIGNDYMAGIITKHRFLDSVKTKKIIFAGGSNLAFGINSAEIEKEFKMPVVNLGLHAGLGLSFMLEELKKSSNKGDVIFLSIEYMLSPEGDYKLKKLTSNFYSNAKNYYSTNYLSEINIHIDNTKENIKDFFAKKKSLSTPSKKTDNIIYSKNAFNVHGDVISHLDKKRPEDLSNRGIMKYKYWKGIKELNEFKNYAETKNIHVFFLYPNYPLTEFKNNNKIIQKYSNDLSKDLQLVILNRPDDFVYNDTLFFDTTYHLTKDGREKRTKKLIEIIKKNNCIGILDPSADF